jgi:outer membrane protein assembly factor BamB
LLKGVAMTRLLVSSLLALSLTGCSGGWLGADEPAPLPGTRIPVLVFDQQMQADPELANRPMQLPPAISNASWATAGGTPSHGGGVLALAETLRQAWRADIGDGVSDERPILPLPVIENGIVYTLDGEGSLTAWGAESGKKLWNANLAPRRLRDKASGGGLAVADGRLYASLGYGEVVALSTNDGSELWRSTIPSPLRSAPAIGAGQVFVLGIDNQLGALDAQTGAINWVHTGMIEAAGLLGAPSPAVMGEMVLVAYSSGELYALRTQNGGEIWSDNLAASRREGGISSIAAIRGMPVLAAGGMAALAVSNSGRLVAIDTRSGMRAWDQRISGQQMPWVAGDTVFLVTSQAQLMAVNLADGKVRWVQQLDLWEHPDDKEGVIAWYGPVLAGGQLWLTNSLGQLQSYHPATGAFTENYKLGESANRPPVVAGGTLFTLDDDGRLTAWR